MPLRGNWISLPVLYPSLCIFFFIINTYYYSIIITLKENYDENNYWITTAVCSLILEAKDFVDVNATGDNTNIISDADAIDSNQMELDPADANLDNFQQPTENGYNHHDVPDMKQNNFLDNEVVENNDENKETIIKIESEEEMIARYKATELEGYWMPVRRDTKDFSAWTSLLDYVEKENKLVNIRQAFDAFLHRYPYCYGYWKKYADVEKRHQNVDSCLQVYERGVQGIPLSVDLWLAYIDSVMDFHRESEDYIDRIRTLYNRAINSAGMDFRSDRLWESFIQWELSTHGRTSLRLVTGLYDRLIYTPTQMYFQNWENFKRHLEENNIEEVLSTEELDALKQETISELGLDAEYIFTENEYVHVKEKARTLREQIYHRTYEEITKRWHFEDKIRRPYFHVKPLESSQITNWNEYLDFEERELELIPLDGDQNIRLHQRGRVLFLYERCLVACALYEEIWLRYARYAEHILQEVETARDVWRRACTIHLPLKLGLRWMWACFEERYYEPEENDDATTTFSWSDKPSWLILEETMRDEDGWYPSHKSNVLFHMRRVDMMRRLGAKTDEVCSTYDESIAYFTHKSNVSAVSILTGRYARFIHYIIKDHLRAKTLLLQAINNDPRNERLYAQLLDLVFHNDSTDENSFCEIIDLALERSLLPLKSKMQFAKRRLQYLEEYGTDVSRILNAEEDFERLIKAYNHSREEAGIIGDSAIAPLHAAGYGGPPAKQANFDTGNPVPEAFAPIPPPQIPTSLLGPIVATGAEPTATIPWEQYAAYYYNSAYATTAYPTNPSAAAVPPHVYST